MSHLQLTPFVPFFESHKLYRRRFFTEAELKEAGQEIFQKNQENIKKNPSKKDINWLISQIPQGFLHTLRAILHNDLYVWSATDLLHAVVMEQMNLPHSAATLEFDFSESPAVVRLSTTNSQINQLLKQPRDKVSELIMSNPHMTAIFGNYDTQQNLSSGPTYKAKFGEGLDRNKRHGLLVSMKEMNRQFHSLSKEEKTTVINTAQQFRANHQKFVDDLIWGTIVAIAPSGSDLFHPELWKAIHWNWFKINKEVQKIRRNLV